MTAPAPHAPFSDKMAYYRTQHTSRGVRFTHLVGTPVIAVGIPLLFAKPRAGLPMFLGGWLSMASCWRGAVSARPHAEQRLECPDDLDAIRSA